MGLTVTTAATETALTTVDRAMERVGTTDASLANDLQRLIDAASDLARKYCGREFSRQEYTEEMTGSGGDLLFLSEAPLVSIDEIRVDGDVMSVDDYEIESTEAGIIYRAGDVWQWRVRNIQTLGGGHPLVGSHLHTYCIDYTAGWLLPDETGRTLPDDVEHAILETVAAWWLMQGGSTDSVGTPGTVGGGVKRRTIDGLTVEYSGPTIAPLSAQAGANGGFEMFPPVAVGILRRYKHLRLVTT
jgi:hypothetical protein